LTPNVPAPENDGEGPVEAPRSLLERFRRATFACNIDSRGRWLRLTGGIGALSAGSLVLLGWKDDTALALLAALAMAAGVFMIFEARASWCVLRGLGFRTRW
jgi:hypothetical protein